MHGKLIVLLSVAAIATASDLQEVPYSSSTPSPIQYVPVANPSGPTIYTYSSPPAPKAAKVEAYQTVTSHPPPSAYKTSPTVASYDPSKYIPVPQYVASPGAYSAAPIPDIANYQGYPGVPISSYAPVPNVYGSVADPVYTTAPNKYTRRTQIQLVDSSDAYTPGFVPQYPGPGSTPAPSAQSISIPVEYPTAVGENVGSHVVYAPVENAEGYNKPIYKPIATYAVQSAYANSVAAYSSAPAVSRVNFNGLGASYGY